MGPETVSTNGSEVPVSEVVHWQIEIRVIEYIEEIRADEQLKALMNRECLVYVEVGIEVPRTAERIPCHVAEVVLAGSR